MSCTATRRRVLVIKRSAILYSELKPSHILFSEFPTQIFLIATVEEMCRKLDMMSFHFAWRMDKPLNWTLPL